MEAHARRPHRATLTRRRSSTARAYEVDVDGCRRRVEVAWIDRDDARIGATGIPEDRAAANAWTRFDEALCRITGAGDELDDRDRRTGDLGATAARARTP